MAAVLLCECVFMPACGCRFFDASVPSPCYSGSTLVSLTACVSLFFTLNTGRGITPQSSLSSRLSDTCNNTHYKETRELRKSNEYTWKLIAFLRVQAVELCDTSFNGTSMQCDLRWHTSGLCYCALQFQMFHLAVNPTEVTCQSTCSAVVFGM